MAIDISSPNKKRMFKEIAKIIAGERIEPTISAEEIATKVLYIAEKFYFGDEDE